MKMRVCAAIVAAVGVSGVASAQFLTVGDSSGDRIMTFDPFDGTLINPNFIVDGGGIGYEFSTPKDAILVNNEIWVSDQIQDAIFRFDLNGNFLSGITTGLDNIRGMDFANGTVYVSNSGSNNGAPGDAVIMYQPDGTLMGNFAAGDPFDILDYDGKLLISDIGSEDILLASYDGSSVSVFHDSDGTTGIDFPQQLGRRGVDHVLAAGFSSPSGVYEYTDEGVQVNYFDQVTGVRGVYELGNGNIMTTSGNGVFVINPDTGAVNQVFAGASGQYINLVPEPASLVLLLGALAVMRRR